MVKIQRVHAAFLERKLQFQIGGQNQDPARGDVPNRRVGQARARSTKNFKSTRT